LLRCLVEVISRRDLRRIVQKNEHDVGRGRSQQKPR
jgi:hypothetical protein